MKSYSDIAGDGGSHVYAQIVGQHQAIADALSGVRHVLAVGSGKGGVGKSTLTMALARALAGRGRRVAILDADFNGPTQAHMAGLEETPWVPGESGRLALPRIEGSGDGTGSLGVVSLGSLLGSAQELAFDTVSQGSQHTWRSTREFALLRQLLSSVEWGDLDHLLFDLPPGAERTVQYAQFFAGALGEGKVSFVMVTLPSGLSHGVVARSLTALSAIGAPALGYIENMAGYWCRDCGEVKPLFPESAEGLDAPCLGRVPFDPELAALCDEGWSRDGVGAGTDNRASEAVSAVEDLVDRLVGVMPGAALDVDDDDATDSPSSAPVVPPALSSSEQPAQQPAEPPMEAEP